MQVVCEICGGRKVVEKPDGTARPCVCTIQSKLVELLGEFANNNINRKIKYEKLHRNLVLKDCNLERFGDMVKTYITNRVLRTSDLETEFVNATGSEITESYLGNHDEYTYTMFNNIDILFIRLGKDYLHKGNREWVPYVIEHRAENPNLVTWVYLYPGIPDSTLIDIYGEKLLPILKTNFVTVK